MRNIIAIGLFFLGTLAVPCLASDGYIGWSEISFRSVKWDVHVTASPTRITSLSISHDGKLIDIPQSAFASAENPWLNGVKLKSVCCSADILAVLEIPVFQFDQAGHSTKRILEISLSDDQFVSVRYQKPSQLDPQDES